MSSCAGHIFRIFGNSIQKTVKRTSFPKIRNILHSIPKYVDKFIRPKTEKPDCIILVEKAEISRIIVQRFLLTS